MAQYKSRLELDGKSMTVRASGKTPSAAAKQIAQQVFGQNIVVKPTKGGKGIGFRAFVKPTGKTKATEAAGKCFHLKVVTPKQKRVAQQPAPVDVQQQAQA